MSRLDFDYNRHLLKVFLIILQKSYKNQFKKKFENGSIIKKIVC